jgi:hypothetical protein
MTRDVAVSRAVWVGRLSAAGVSATYVHSTSGSRSACSTHRLHTSNMDELPSPLVVGVRTLCCWQSRS